MKRFTVGVADLRQRLGARRTIDIDVVMPEQRVIASRSVATSPVVGAVVVESIERGVSVLGEVDYCWVGDCRRCLEPVEGASEVTIDEIYQVDAPDDADIIALEGDQIDLLPLIRDAVLVGLPLAPLCREDCGGPDPDRYPAQTQEEFDEQVELEKQAELAEERDGRAPLADPRWAALDDLQLDD